MTYKREDFKIKCRDRKNTSYAELFYKKHFVGCAKYKTVREALNAVISGNFISTLLELIQRLENIDVEEAMKDL